MKKSSCILYSVLSLLVLGTLFFRINPEGVYAYLGDYNFRHNHIEEAQNFYEKAFSYGYSNVETRNAYVNSIINSPLTIDAQEKLVKLAEGKNQDKAASMAKYFLQNLRSQIHKKYPENYIQQATMNQKIVRWNKFPITYSFKNADYVPSEYLYEIRDAFNQWRRLGKLSFVEESENGNIVIDFIDNSKHQTKAELGRKYVVAYTVPKINSNILSNMDIKFYIYNSDGTKFTRNQIYNTALHEICHALGFMGHSLNPDDVMYMSKEVQVMYDDNREDLTNSDIITLQLLYKIRPDITNSKENQSEYLPYLVLGDDNILNESKVKEARSYIRNAPSLPTGYIDLAENYVAQERYVDAIKCLEKAFYLAENDEIKHIIYYNLAIAYYYIGNIDLALNYIDKAKEIKDTEDIHSLRAEVLYNEDKLESERELLYLIALSPDKPEYVLRLAYLYVKDSSYFKARKVLKTFLKTHPQYRSEKRFSQYGILIL